MRQGSPDFGEEATVLDLGLARELFIDGRAIVTVEPEGTPVLIIKTRRGVFAMENRCPHAGYPLDNAAVRRRHIKCRVHGLKYDMTSGVCRSGPGSRTGPLSTYCVWVHQGHLFLAWRTDAK
jgi:3-phenylpropionate/trans-cinnamate dioxygenase ferredoxin component